MKYDYNMTDEEFLVEYGLFKEDTSGYQEYLDEQINKAICSSMSGKCYVFTSSMTKEEINKKWNDLFGW